MNVIEQQQKTPRWLTQKHKEYQRKYSKEYQRRPNVIARRKEEARKRKLDPAYREKLRQYHRNYVNKDRFANLARHVVRRSRGNGMECDPDYLFELASAKPTHCPCCGKEFDLSYQKNSGKPPLHGASFDRVDCEKGYIRGNVAIICWRCSAIKRDATLSELETIVRYMKQHYANN